MSELTTEEMMRNFDPVIDAIIEFGVRKHWSGNTDKAARAFGTQMTIGGAIDIEKRTLKIYVGPVEQPSSIGLCLILIFDLEGEQPPSPGPQEVL